MEEKEFLNKARDLFMRFGIKSMTMDEIARQLGISKKTVYQFVDNKKDLVYKMMNQHINSEQCEYKEMFENIDNAIDEIMEITKEVRAEMKQLHPSVMFDLKKYHPEAFNLLVQHKEEFIGSCIQKNLENGVKNGWYRENINPSVLSKLYLAMVSCIIDPDNFPSHDFKFSEVHTEMMRYHIRGIASPKGMEYLKHKFKQDNV